MMMSEINDLEPVAPFCNKPTHEGEEIKAFCVREKCT